MDAVVAAIRWAAATSADKLCLHRSAQCVALSQQGSMCSLLVQPAEGPCLPTPQTQGALGPWRAAYLPEHKPWAAEWKTWVCAHPSFTVTGSWSMTWCATNHPCPWLQEALGIWRADLLGGHAWPAQALIVRSLQLC